MNYSHRFFLYAPLGVFLAIAAGVGVHWWFSADALAARLKAMNRHELVPGVTLYFGTERITGFPFSLDTEMRDVTITIKTPHGPAQWHADRFAMHALTYGRDETVFEAAGPQVLHWTRDDGKGRTLTFQVGSMHASAIRGRQGLARFDLDIVGFGSRAFTAQRLQFHLRRDRDSIDLYATTDGVRFSKADAPGLGGSIAGARLSATVTQGAAFEDLLAGTAPWFATVNAWRAAGGRLKVDTLSLHWNEMTITGNGALSLDKKHAPQGSIALRITGVKSFMARAAKDHLAHGPNDGVAAALIDTAGSGDRLDTKLGFGNGMVTLGGEPADTVTRLY